MRAEAREVDAQLERAQIETSRLQALLRTRETEVQALRERVIAQRAERQRRQEEQARKRNEE